MPKEWSLLLFRCSVFSFECLCAHVCQTHIQYTSTSTAPPIIICLLYTHSIAVLHHNFNTSSKISPEVNMFTRTFFVHILCTVHYTVCTLCLYVSVGIVFCLTLFAYDALYVSRTTVFKSLSLCCFM